MDQPETTSPSERRPSRARRKSTQAPSGEKKTPAITPSESEMDAMLDKNTSAEPIPAELSLETVENLPERDQQGQSARRGSFIVRVQVNEQGQFGRTEIERVPSTEEESVVNPDKGSFVTPNGERLIAFMRASLDKARGGALEPAKPKSQLTVAGVHLFAPDTLGRSTLTLRANEPVMIQVRFGLARELIHSRKQLDYEIRVSLLSVSSGRSELLTTCRDRLPPNQSEYTIAMDIPGLSPGLYRLFTTIAVDAETKLTGYYDGPLVDVS